MLIIIYYYFIYLLFLFSNWKITFVDPFVFHLSINLSNFKLIFKLILFSTFYLVVYA